MENTSTSVCLNELIAIEHGELRSQIKLQAANALLTAAENVSDAVEITSEAYEVQVRGIYPSLQQWQRATVPPMERLSY